MLCAYRMTPKRCTLANTLLSPAHLYSCLMAGLSKKSSCVRPPAQRTNSSAPPVCCQLSVRLSSSCGQGPKQSEMGTGQGSACRLGPCGVPAALDGSDAQHNRVCPTHPDATLAGLIQGIVQPFENRFIVLARGRLVDVAEGRVGGQASACVAAEQAWLGAAAATMTLPFTEGLLAAVNPPVERTALSPCAPRCAAR